MDSLQRTVRRVDDPDILDDKDARRLTDALKERELQLFMLSNQLPLLEAGQDPQEITGAEAEFAGRTRPGAASDSSRAYRWSPSVIPTT